MVRSVRALGLLILLALVALAAPAEAQRKGGGRGRKKAPPPEVPVPEVAPDPGPQLPLTLPGIDPPAGPGANAGARDAAPAPKPARKPGAPEPIDPMKEADKVRAIAEHRALQEEARARLLGDHFKLCDLDRNDWISLREAEITLSLDRNEYRRADKNQDGRLDLPEFTDQGDAFLSRLGALPAEPPAAPEATPPEEPPAGAELELATSEPGPATEPAASESGAEVSEPAGRTAEPEGDTKAAGRALRLPPLPHSELVAMRVQPAFLLARYDTDASRGIDAHELEAFLREAELHLSAEVVVEQMDPDDSGQLEETELVPLCWIASRRLSETLLPLLVPPEPVPEPTAESASEIETPIEPGPESGTEAEPEAEEEATPPRELPFGFAHFARLDVDHDGFLDEADLRKLQSPARLDLRLKAVLSAMDLDGDGRLSSAEFDAAMRGLPDVGG